MCNQKDFSMLNVIVRFVVLAFCSALAWADGLPVAEVDYSAVKHIHSAQGDFVQQVYFAKGKERSEMQMQGMSMVLINRADKGIAWQLMPMQQMYSEINLNKAKSMSGSAPSDVSIEDLGYENLDGVLTAKYKLVLKDKSAGGFIWLSPEKIPVKMDFLSKEGNTKNRITMTLSDLKLGAQPAELFELPKGYKPMPTMGNLMKNMH
jgi:outer membrane lipoprotein-sorting protein